MGKIQVGTILYEDEETTEIYQKYEEYFRVEYQWKILKEYVISKEPSPELIADLEAYYARVKERNRKHDAFVDWVAKEVLEELSQEDKDYVFLYPSSTEHHHGLGLMIRNRYIHGKKLGFQFGDPDELSSDITERIASLLIEEYDYENLFYRHLYNSFTYGKLRRLYYAIKGEYPDKLVTRYADEPDDLKAARQAEKMVRKVVLNKRRFRHLCRKYGLTAGRQDECEKVIDAYNKDKRNVVPYDIALLASGRLEPEVREKCLRLLQAALKEKSDLALNLPAYVFGQKDAVILAVSERGKALKRFPRFCGDNDVIKAALTDNGEAIQYVRKDLRDRRDYLELALSDMYDTALQMRCMAKYRDDEEIVKLALAGNGRNIKFASARLKDDLEMAKFAVTHQKDWYPESTVCNLSASLRDNLEIALLDIREGHACVRDYSKRLRDSDEVAQALMETDNKWKLYQMSERIQKKYRLED